MKIAFALQVALAILGLWLLLEWAQGAPAEAANPSLSCSTWVYDHQSENDAGILAANMESTWVDGFLAGRVRNYQSPVSFAASAMEIWISHYCAKHPKLDVSVAASAFARSHTAEQIAAGSLN